MKIEEEIVTASILVTGRVQGVWYRDFARRQALRLGLKGWVKNMPDESVYLEVEGRKDVIEKLIEKLNVGPQFARVDQVQVDWLIFNDRFQSFMIQY